MRLDQEQLEDYHQNGFLVIEDYFSQAELDMLTGELPEIFKEVSDRRVLERNGSVRTVFASHKNNEVFECLSRLERLVEPARQMLESDVYIHQFKINAKAALAGEQWEWHQDFLYWHKEDHMPEPRVVTAVIFLQNVNEFNGPILILPGSHREGMINLAAEDRYVSAIGAGVEASWASTLTADLKYKVSRDTLAHLASKTGIYSVTVRAGAVMYFHGNLFHASSNNLSPWDRISVFVSYNSVENALGMNSNPRPDFIAARDFSPITPLPDDSLLQMGVCVE
jgi:ectoine hydroxylase